MIEAVERETPVLDETKDTLEIVRPPFRGDAHTRLAHEGGRKGEGERPLVEAGEHDLAAGRQSRDKLIEDRRIAADVVDDAIVAARVVVGRDDVVAFGAARALRITFPDRRLAAGDDAQPRQQAAQHAMPDDEFAALRRSTPPRAW